jgi:hypothetical protein
LFYRTSTSHQCTISENHIRSIKGVKDILATKDVNQIGRFNILVHKDEFVNARTKLQQSLTQWYESYVPTDAQPRPETFPGIPSVRPIAFDGNSSGENSWMSKSNVSFLSMDLSSVQNDDYFSSAQSMDRKFSYASILKSKSMFEPKSNSGMHNNNPNDEDNKEVISEITIARTESETNHLHELKALRTSQTNKINEARNIIKIQEIEIQKLKEAQKQAIEAYDKVASESPNPTTTLRTNADRKTHESRSKTQRGNGTDATRNGQFDETYALDEKRR